MAIAEIANSSYLDFTGYGVVAPGVTTVTQAWDLTAGEITTPDASWKINVALILDRATDPAALLAADWATRQQILGSMTQDEIFAMYGADQDQYNEVLDYLGGSNPASRTYTVLGLSGSDANGDYVSSAASRTIWVELDAASFKDLFGTDLYLANSPTEGQFLFWNGNLSLPEEAGVVGLWLDTENIPPADNLAPGVSVTLPDGSQSIGNQLGTLGQNAAQNPQVAASDYYNFPLANFSDVQTGAIGLIEPGIGTALRASAEHDFQYYLERYYEKMGVIGTGTAYTQGASGQEYGSGAEGERSLDVGMVSAINPNSDIALYVGSGYNGAADASTFTAYQSAIWQTPAGVPAGWINPAVLSSSFGDLQAPSPDSPFYAAYWQLMIDAVLMNKSVFTALGDGGSGNELGNGLTNLEYNYASPYTVLVGGTSISTTQQAELDSTLTWMLQLAEQSDRAVLWRLVQGGLTTLPQDATDANTFLEAVWNEYYVDGNSRTIIEGGYQQNNTSSGGVDTTQPTPSYQLAYGLTPTAANTPFPGQGRGLPDVSANAGGNLYYWTPDGSMEGLTEEGGTSAATPLWASLAVQINTIFADQGLPQLGYMTDLLYIASAIAPAAFNDIQFGNNISSFSQGGDYTSNGEAITPTGYGFEAAPGYDLVSGLGTPNGTVLARALLSIAHAQMSFADQPDVLIAQPVDPSDPSSPTFNVSGASQSLLFQPIFASDTAWALELGTSTVSFSGLQSAAYAWTNQLAQQVVQADFSNDLVTLFDGFSQGSLYQAQVAVGTSVGISIGGADAGQPQMSLTSQFGFVDYVNDAQDSAVQVARPIAIAETANAADDQMAVVRMRQSGVNDSAITFYKVDDFNGTIGGIDPGEAGYAAAVQARAYSTTDGDTAISGQGFGVQSQAFLTNVDAGDLIAMMLTSAGHTYYAFAQANEQVNGEYVGHLWNYGLNTWGWEDLYGGGDQDYNDLVVQLDFTSAAGSGWLI
ncbi:DUF4114 domain-containing protein [Aquabacter cavernae]|uniref:DUF4114 domain-containing protein n=1 Tax=Aquabacter cavernae TaxID=2496029 RepID=UPI000F8E1D62|nr:DUF4114 domain-containing protein [Aquabacter cavernae]